MKRTANIAPNVLLSYAMVLTVQVMQKSLYKVVETDRRSE